MENLRRPTWRGFEHQLNTIVHITLSHFGEPAGYLGSSPQKHRNFCASKVPRPPELSGYLGPS